jgi:hypothetical protein
MASVLSQYAESAHAIEWGKDWRKYPDATAKSLLSIAVTYWECFRIKEANQIIQHALTLPHEPASNSHRVLAGLYAVIRGDFQLAAQHSMTIDQSQLPEWYRRGYTMLLLACQLRPVDGKTQNLKELLNEFNAGCFGTAALKSQDKFTCWLSYRLRAALAAAHGRRIASWIEQIKAFGMTG